MLFDYNTLNILGKKVQGGVKKLHIQTSVYLFCIVYTINSPCFVRFHKQWKMAEFWQV